MCNVVERVLYQRQKNTYVAEELYRLLNMEESNLREQEKIIKRLTDMIKAR